MLETEERMTLKIEIIKEVIFLDKKPNLNIPIIFQKLKSYEVEDTRFMQVKIWLMHLEENLNNSYFEKSVVEDAIPSLANTPILAYVEDNSEGEKDFSDHRMVLVKEDGQFKIKYIGQAIGVIPETNNAQFEMRICDDGIEREFLTVDGLLWTKFDDPIDIMNRDKFKAESMELHEDYEGEYKDDNLFHFTKFKFYGACGLGNSTLPAMQNATIESKFSFDDFQKELQNKMEQFKLFQLQQNQSSKEVDNNMNFIKKEDGRVDDKLELLAKYNLKPEDISFSIDEFGLEEIEVKIKEQIDSNEQFSLSNNQLLTEINKILESVTEVRENYWGELVERKSFYLMDLKDENAIVVTYDWDTYYGIPYTVIGDSVTLDFDNKVEFIPDWRVKESNDVGLFTSVKEIISNEINVANEKFAILENDKNEVQGKLDSVTTEFEQVKPEFERLQQFEQDTLTDQRKQSEDTLFSQFDEKLAGIEEYEKLKETASQFELEDLKKECYVILGKQSVNFSTKTKDKNKFNDKVKVDFSKRMKEEHNQVDEFIGKHISK